MKDNLYGKVLITGATGFLGFSIARCLVDRKDLNVLGVVRRDPNYLALGFELIKVGDLDTKTNWFEALQGVDIVIHTAARVHVMNDSASEPLNEFRKVNVEGTLNLARQAVDSNIKRFIFISSIKVNGEETKPGEAFSEADENIPDDYYALSKLEAEQGLLALAEDSPMEVVIIRPPLVYGPGVKGNFATMVKLVRKELPLPFGSVNNRRSLLALDNLVDFITLCVDVDKTPKAANQVFLVSDAEDVSTSTLLRKIANAYSARPLLIPVPVGLMKFFARVLGKRDISDRLFGNLQVDNSKARSLLGWVPVVTMEEQLNKMAKIDD